MFKRMLSILVVFAVSVALIATPVFADSEEESNVASGALLQSVYDDREPDTITTITNAGNKLTPVNSVIAGKKSAVNVVGLNHKLYLSRGSASAGTIAYVPYAIYWSEADKLVEFYDWNSNLYTCNESYDFVIEVTDSTPETASFTVYYDNYVFDGTSWHWNNQSLYQQTLTLVVNGTLTYNANGGKTTKTVYVPNGSNYALPTVTRSGFKFDGWYTEAVGGTKLSTAKTVTFSASKSSVTVYAHWTKPVTLKFDLKGGKLTASAKKKYANAKKPYKVTYNKKYGTLPTPTKAGYKFRGWYPSTSAQAKKVTKATSVTKAGAHKLVAQWLKKGTGKYVTKAEYKLLKKGYTYAECKIIIGGAAAYSTNRDGYKAYAWFGDKSGDTGVVAMFENGVLTFKEYVS
jgi:uncharacterized repeat protein (TIGR02543 family)